MAIIEFKNVTKVYPTGTSALRDVSFSVEEGEFVFLVGESGAGKSTIFKLLTCEERPTSGKVLINGCAVSHLRDRYIPYLRREMGLIFQDFRLIDSMTVGENVAFAMQIIGEPDEKIKQRVPLALSVVGLRNKIDEYPSELSGGEAQRVCIARAIINRPKIIVADEPTGDLDPINGEAIMALLERINKANGTTVITCSHDRVLIDKMRKRVIEVNQGKLIGDTPFGLYFHHSDASAGTVPEAERPDYGSRRAAAIARDAEEQKALISEGDAALDALRREDEEEAKRQQRLAEKKKTTGISRFRTLELFSKEDERAETGAQERKPLLRREARDFTAPLPSDQDGAAGKERENAAEAAQRDLRPENRLERLAHDDRLMDMLRQRSAKRRARKPLDARLQTLQDTARPSPPDPAEHPDNRNESDSP